MPEENDEMDALMRKLATDRKAFAAKLPGVHEADIRRIFREARNQQPAGEKFSAGWLQAVVAFLSRPRWAMAGAVALLLIFAIVAIPSAHRDAGQEFSMVADGYRGDAQLPAEFQQLKLRISLNRDEAVIQFQGGALISGKLTAESPAPSLGGPASYTFQSSAANAGVGATFKGVVLLAADPVKPSLIKQASLRGILTTDGQDYSITAGTDVK